MSCHAVNGIHVKIVPYKEVGGVWLGSAKDVVVQSLGAPAQIGSNSLGLVELVYQNMTVRLDPKSECVKEVTVNSKYLTIDSRSIAFIDLGSFIAEEDPQFFESHGFVVSPRYGVAFDPYDRYFTTVFLKCDLTQWQN